MNYYIINYKLNGFGESGEPCNSTFDLKDACEVCGTGGRISQPLKVKGILGSKKDLFQTKDQDFLVSHFLYSKIKETFPDINLNKIIDYHSRELGFYHLAAEHVLSRFEPSSSGFEIEYQCKNCLRNGYFNKAKMGNLESGKKTKVFPLKLMYKKNILNQLNSNILNTWECIGLSNRTNSGAHVVRYARPWTIVSGALKEIFELCDVKNIEYQKISGA